MQYYSRVFLRLAAVIVSVAFIAGPAHAEKRSCISKRNRIVGGEIAIAGSWPGQVALRLASKDGSVAFYFCGGTAISDRWVLTAAHCITNYVSKLNGSLRDSKGKRHKGRLEAVIGAENLTKVASEQVFSVEKVVVHEHYRAEIDAAFTITDPRRQEIALNSIAQRIGDDIALIRLARPWTGPVALLSLSNATDPVTPPGAQVRTAGFGKTENNKQAKRLDRFRRTDGQGELFAGSARLLEAAVETVATSRCAAHYDGSIVGAGQICAGLELGGRDSCQCDSGGPLMAYDAGGCPRQIGVVSWGEGCAKKEAYGVYTRVSHYADWIQKYTGPLKGAQPAAYDEVFRLSAAQLDEALHQLDTLLSPAKGRAQIGMRGGNRVQLGDTVIFEAISEVGGRLIILDINADRQVMLLYPNQYTGATSPGQIMAGERIAVPGLDYPGFTGFYAQEPVGKGRLVVLVVPEEFDIERFAAGLGIRSKGFQPVNNPPNYLMRLIRQIETMLGAHVNFGNGSANLPDWGYGLAEYEIVR